MDFPRKLQSRNRRLTLEPLEPRIVLSTMSLADYGLASPAWFARHSAAVESNDALRWIVRLSRESLGGIASVDAAASLLNHDSFRVVGGLGLPGQLLVEAAADPAIVERTLSEDPHVAYFDRSHEVFVQAAPNDSDFVKQFALHNTGQTGGTADADIDAVEAWDVTTGDQDIVVAILDSGVDYNHPDLAANIWTNPGEIPGNGEDDDGNGLPDDIHGWNFSVDKTTDDPLDDNGHGTHVAGIIGAVANNDLGISGVAQNVSLMALKFLDHANRGFVEDAISAVNYATMMRQKFNVNIRAINASWTTTDDNDNLKAAIESAGEVGILFVASAGNGNVFRLPNDNDVIPIYPASFDSSNIISVTATDADDQLVPFFNFGQQAVDLAAPGLNIFSTDLDGGYSIRSGTSMAAPHVTGAAALVWSVLPDATVDEVRDAILASVDAGCDQPEDPLCSLDAQVATGGRLNLQAAVTIDRHRPRATLRAADVETRGDTVYQFEVDFRDNVSLAAASLDDNDFTVRKFGDPASAIAAIFVDPAPMDSMNVTGQYRIVPPGGSWDDTDNGVYEVVWLADSVADSAGNTSPANLPLVLGTFSVDAPFPGEFRVNSFQDGVDANPGDGMCETAVAGQCTLRAAVTEANAADDDNVIVLTAGRYELAIAGDGVPPAAAGDLDITNTIGAVTIVGVNGDIDVKIVDGVNIELAGVSERELSTSASALTQSGDPTVQTLHVPAGAAISAGDTFSLEFGGTPHVFEFIDDGTEPVGTTAVRFDRTDSAEDVAKAIVEAITGRLQTVIDGAGITRVFDVNSGANLTLRNLTVRGGFNNGSGGGIANRGGTLRLEHTTVIDNHATSRGGGLWQSSGSTVIVDSRFEGNSAGNEGGGIFNSEGASLTVQENAVVVGNSAKRFGGGISNEGTLEVFDSTIQENAAAISGTGAGGGIATTGPTDIQRSWIVGNVANPAEILPDAFEPNDDVDNPADLIGGDLRLDELTIHEPGESDYYRWEAHGDGVLTVDILFSDEIGDLDLQLRDENDELLDSSASTSDNESVSVDVTAGQVINIRVHGFRSATHTDYSLVIDGPPRTSGGDALEPNNTRETANDLHGGPQKRTGLSINPSDDFFKWTATVNTSFKATINFDHDEGDLDLELLDANGGVIDDSTSTGDSETVSHGVFAGETVFVRVHGFEGATAAYDLTIEADSQNIGGGGLWIAGSSNGDTAVTISESTFEANSATEGGGIHNDNGGKVTITDSFIIDNVATSPGGGFSIDDFFDYTAGGGIYTSDELTVQRTTITGNRASVGGGIDISPFNTAPVSIIDSTISRNTAKEVEYSAGGGIRNGNPDQGGGPLAITRSSIENNFSRFEGGGVTNSGQLTLTASTVAGNIAGFGGGISNWGQATIETSTISENFATEQLSNTLFANFGLTGGVGGGVYSIRCPLIASTNTQMSIRNSTVTANAADVSAAGLVADASEVTSANTIIANNVLVGGNEEDIFARSLCEGFLGTSGTFESGGNNLIGSAFVETVLGVPTGEINQHATDRDGIFPLLSPLQDNGGPTRTHLPLPGSPAIDSGQLAGGATHDQRGIARPKDGNDNGTITADVGAVERFFAEIAGTIFHDLDESQTQNNDEEGLAGRVVFLDLNRNDMHDEDDEPHFVTGDDGSFRFRLIDPETTYRVAMLPSPLFRATLPLPQLTAIPSHEVFVGTGQVVEDIDFGRLGISSQVEGGSFNDINGDGVRDDGEAGIPDWEITLRKGDQTTSILTGPDGRFVATELPPGSYVVDQVLRSGPDQCGGAEDCWERTSPLPAILLDVDFSDADGSPAAEGFDIVPSAGAGWHLSVCRGGDAGHSSDDAFRFGYDATCGSEGNYPAGVSQSLVSPLIDLTHVSGTVRLTLNHFLDIADADRVSVNVLVGGQRTPLADNQAADSPLSGTTGFEAVSLDVSEFAGQEIQLEFLVETDLDATRRETITAAVNEDETYFVKVVGAANPTAGNTVPRYQLNINAPGTPEDRFEAGGGNDTREDATEFETISFVTEDNLTIHTAGDDDFYSFMPDASGIWTVSTEFEHRFGDVDLTLFDESGMRLASSRSVFDNETVSATLSAGETYYVKVEGFGNATSPRYRLTIDGPGIHTDTSEPNDDFGGATELGTIADARRELTIHEAGNADYFAFEARTSGTYRIDAFFTHADGDIDLFVYDENEQLLTSSTSVGDNESASITASAGDRFFVRVLGFAGATHPGYTLSIDGPGIEPDRFTGNDTMAAAAVLNRLGTTTLDDLSIHQPADEDWFEFTADASGVVNIDIKFDAAQGDADIFLIDASGMVIASSLHEGWFVDDVRVEALGTYEIKLQAGEVFPRDIVFGNRALEDARGEGLDGEIAGHVFVDFFRNQQHDDQEDMLDGVTVILDLNRNGMFDAGDRTAVTDAEGRYEFAGLGPGTYSVLVDIEPHPSMQQSFPVRNEFTPMGNGFSELDRPQSLVFGHFDANNDIDIAVANYGGEGVTVLLNVNTENISDPMPTCADGGAWAIDVMDSDDDKKEDLIVADIYGGVTLCYGDGQGGFSEPEVIIPKPPSPTKISPSSIATGDLDGDGLLDVVVTLVNKPADFDDDVAVVLNLGNRTFADAVLYPVRGNPYSVIVRDFNADEELDIVVADFSTGDVAILTGVGDGTFHDAEFFDVGLGVFSLAAGDFNGDEQPDIAALNVVFGELTILVNQTASGAVELLDTADLFEQTVVIGVGNASSNVRVEHIDQDGHLDLIVTDSSEQGVQILLNDGSGGFSGTGVSASGRFPDQSAFSVNSADIDNDFDQDLAITKGRSQVQLLRNSLVARPHRVSVGAGLQVATASFGLAPKLPWQNPTNPLNVDGDPENAVTPLDVLLIINRINRHGNGRLPFPSQKDHPSPFFDVDGDNEINARDVIVVINAINDTTPVGGEGIDPPSPPQAILSNAAFVDAVFESLIFDTRSRISTRLDLSDPCPIFNATSVDDFFATAYDTPVRRLDSEAHTSRHEFFNSYSQKENEVDALQAFLQQPFAAH